MQHVTSKHFCTRSNHFSCHHDWDHHTPEIRQTIISLTVDTLPYETFTQLAQKDEDEKDKLIRELLGELALTRKQSEAYWQRKLQGALAHTSIGRQKLTRHRFVTDLSNADILIEIKNQKDFRAAFGQIADYSARSSRASLKYILLFGESRHWDQSLWLDRRAICSRHGIDLRWLKD